MTDGILIDKCRGSLFGGAVGDALGYAVEFLSLDTIRRRYGPEGIAAYDLTPRGIAEFSDDTQMSLFTAEGLLNAVRAGKRTPEAILPYITKAYLNWYRTQTEPMTELDQSRLSFVTELWSRRAPGTTCMTALRAIDYGNEVVNNSKGCGGIMRVAPIGIFAAAHPDILGIAQAGLLAGLAADITHKHSLSTLSSMVLAMVVAECITAGKVGRDEFADIVGRAMDCLPDDTYLPDLRCLVQKTLDLALSDRSDTDAILILGEGWVAEETLAIALFSVMRYIDDFGKCIRCAVNHNGDSDSTGAVAGNIIGAILGYSAIPEEYRRNLELGGLLLSMADALAEGKTDETD